MTVIINQPRFLQAVRPVLLDRGRFATGRIRRRKTLRATELIIDEWSVSDVTPNGRTLAPMMDWAVMTTNFGGMFPVERLPEIVQPRQSHLLVAISLHPDNYRALSVLIWDEGTLRPPERLHFIGHGLLTLPDPIQLTSSGKDSKDDQLADRGEVQEDRQSESPTRLRASRTAGALGSLYFRLATMLIIIVGAGRGAQELARQLVAAGLRRLIIIDSDTIGPENLDAMPMARVLDLGMNKATHLARALRRNQPDLVTSAVPHSVTSVDGMRTLRETRADTVFSFIDNNVGRLAVARLCQETDTMHLDVGTLTQRNNDGRMMSADVRLLEPRLGCVACVPEMPQLEDVLYELAAPSDSLHRGRQQEWNEQRAGSLLHLNAMASSLAIETWFRWLNGDIQTSHWLRLRWPASGTPEVIEAAVGPSPSCRFCNPQSE